METQRKLCHNPPGCPRTWGWEHLERGRFPATAGLPEMILKGKFPWGGWSPTPPAALALSFPSVQLEHLLEQRALCNVPSSISVSPALLTVPLGLQLRSGQSPGVTPFWGSCLNDSHYLGAVNEAPLLMKLLLWDSAINEGKYGKAPGCPAPLPWMLLHGEFRDLGAWVSRRGNEGSAEVSPRQTSALSCSGLPCKHSHPSCSQVCPSPCCVALSRNLGLYFPTVI